MSAYDKLSKQVQKKTIPKKRILTLSEDSDASERYDIPNVFLDSSHQYIDFDSKPTTLKVNKNEQIKNSVLNRRNKNNSSILKGRNRQQKISQKNEIQLVDDSQIPQGEEQVEQNTQFSIFESYKFYMGQLINPINYPLHKILAIDNNNDEQNALNRKQLRVKNKTAGNHSVSNQYYLSNSLNVSFFLYVWHIFSSIFIFRMDFYIYLAIMIANLVVQKEYFKNNAQYIGEAYILLVVSIIYFVGHFILGLLSGKSRIFYKENQEKFKVYFHDGVSAQWMILPATDLKAGHIYKVPSKSTFPSDVILLHSQSSMVLIDDNRVKTKNPQPIFEYVLKQTIIKAETIVLPISGMLQMSIYTPQIRNNWFEGNLTLQEPIQIKHNVNVDNLVLRGSHNLSQNQVLCMCLQVGSNSINLKNVQYPYVYKENEQIIERNTQLSSSKKLINLLILISSLIYFILTGVGILVGYLTNKMSQDHSYLGGEIRVANLVFYHFVNFIILLPIFLELSILTFTFVSGKITQLNISKRRFQFSESQEQNQIAQTLGKLKIKDYSIIPYLKNPFTLVTGIEIFKNKKQFKLKRIIVKEVKFDFEKDNLEHGLFGQQHKQLIKYFMSVSLLTTLAQNNENKNFQNMIRKSAKQQFDLKLSKQKQIFTVSGPLQSVFSQGKLQVIHLFTIQSCSQFPYTISFYQIPTQIPTQNSQKRVLCLIRGDPEYILMKAYGKKINLLTESDKYHQQHGYQMHFLGKFTIFYADAQILKNTYQYSSTQKNKFYSMLDPYFKKVQPLGLLAFENQFSLQNSLNMKSNPFLNLSMLNKTQSVNSLNKFSSQGLPNTIIICPPCDNSCTRPQFQSVNTVNRILTNPLLYNFNQRQIGDKILYDPITVEETIEKLNRQKVLVLNGWDNKNISFMLNGLKEKGILTLGLIEKQQQIFLTKICDYSIGRNSEVDINKYTDMQIQQRKQTPKIMAFMTVIQLLNHDSHLVHNGINNLMLGHMVKLLCYLTVQAINLVYTLGSGITVIRFPLYILTEIILMMDVLFHFNISDSHGFKFAQRSTNLLFQVVKTIFMCIVGVLIIIYSSISPHSSEATPVNSVFCVVQIHLLITHIIIFSKLTWINELSWFKIVVLIIQVATYYIGMLIISQTSFYEFNGVIRYIFNNKLYLVTIIVLWTFLFVYLGQIFFSFSNKIIKKTAGNKYTQLKRVNKETNLQILQA